MVLLRVLLYEHVTHKSIILFRFYIKTRVLFFYKSLNDKHFSSYYEKLWLVLYYQGKFSVNNIIIITAIHTILLCNNNLSDLGAW